MTGYSFLLTKKREETWTGYETQLVQTEKGSEEVLYEYDANGNLTKKSEGTLRYFGPFIHKIEDSSNQTDYYWDSGNLLTKISKTVSGTTTDYAFEYDALGRREKMISGGTTTEYTYEGLKVLTEKTGSTTVRYTNGPQAVGGIINEYNGSTIEYYYYDALGNTVLTTDHDGFEVAQPVNDAFGNVTGDQIGYHLTTKEYFDDFGLYYFNARWYDPEIGRWISASINYSDVEHAYVYVDNNPSNFTDPTGKYSIAPSCAKYLKDRNINDLKKCEKIAGKATNTKIRQCLIRACNDSNFILTCDDPTACGTAGSHIGYPPIGMDIPDKVPPGIGGTKIKDPRVVTICPGNYNSIKDWIEEIIHEFAHECGTGDHGSKKWEGCPFPDGKHPKFGNL